jgi:hypothetical protein
VHRNGFLLNNGPDALIIQILFLSENSTSFGQLLCPSSGVPYCTSTLVGFMQVFDDRFQVSILTMPGSGHQNLHETYQCRKYSRELLMMGREDARSM